MWQNQRRMDAEWKYDIQKSEEMRDKGLKEIELYFDEIKYEEHTLEYDFLAVFSENMPKTRNNFAHGASTLHNQVLTIFENVSIIINKIFKPDIVGDNIVI